MNCSRRGVKISFSILQIIYSGGEEKGKYHKTPRELVTKRRSKTKSMKVHFGKAGKSHRRGGRTLAPQNPPGETSPNPARSRSRRWQCLHPERRGRRKASGGGGREERPGHETKSPSRWPRSRREPFRAAAADESRAPRRLRGGRAGPGRAALGVSAAGGHGRRERPPAACPRLLRRGSPLAGRSPSLRGLALASAPLPSPGPRAPLRVPDRPTAGAPRASGASATPGRSADALQPPPPPSGGAGVTASEPQCRSTPAPAAGRASAPLPPRRYPSADSPPSAPLPLDCGRRKPLHERAPGRPAAAQVLAACWGARGAERAGARGLQLRRRTASRPRPGRLPGLRGRGWARLRKGVCLLARSCLIMVYFLPECLL